MSWSGDKDQSLWSESHRLKFYPIYKKIKIKSAFMHMAQVYKFSIEALRYFLLKNLMPSVVG